MKAVKAKCAHCVHFIAQEYNRKGKPGNGNCQFGDTVRHTHASMKCSSFKLDQAVNGTVMIKKDAA